MLATTGDDGHVRMWKSKILKIFKGKHRAYKFLSFIVNYQRNWKFAAILKSDGTQSIQGVTAGSGGTGTTTANTTTSTTKYFKGSSISHTNEVPRY